MASEWLPQQPGRAHKNWEEAAEPYLPCPGLLWALKHHSPVSPGVVLGEGDKVQIIKQGFHSFSRLATHRSTHISWSRLTPQTSAFPFGVMGPVCQECLHCYLMCAPSSAPCLTGTTERVCLVQGTAEALNAVHSFIAEKVREIPQAMTKPEVVNILQPQTTMNPDRAKQVSWEMTVGFCKAACTVGSVGDAICLSDACLLGVNTPKSALTV